MQGGNAALRVKSLELRVKIWYVRLRGHIFIEWDEKAFSFGEKVARLRAGCGGNVRQTPPHQSPAVTASPKGEKPYRYPQNRGRGMPRPYRAMICIAP